MSHHPFTMKKLIPSDELTAIYNVHAHHGRKAKSMIRAFWMTGNYHQFASSIDYSALQRFRNSEHGGNTGLNKLNLKKLAEDLGL